MPGVEVIVVAGVLWLAAMLFVMALCVAAHAGDEVTIWPLTELSPADAGYYVNTRR